MLSRRRHISALLFGLFVAVLGPQLTPQPSKAASTDCTPFAWLDSFPSLDHFTGVTVEVGESPTGIPNWTVTPDSGYNIVDLAVTIHLESGGGDVVDKPAPLIGSASGRGFIPSIEGSACPTASMTSTTAASTTTTTVAPPRPDHGDPPVTITQPPPNGQPLARTGPRLLANLTILAMALLLLGVLLAVKFQPTRDS